MVLIINKQSCVQKEKEVGEKEEKGEEGKGSDAQTWWPNFDSGEPYGKKWDWTPTSYTLSLH